MRMSLSIKKVIDWQPLRIWLNRIALTEQQMMHRERNSMSFKFKVGTKFYKTLNCSVQTAGHGDINVTLSEYVRNPRQFRIQNSLIVFGCCFAEEKFVFLFRFLLLCKIAVLRIIILYMIRIRMPECLPNSRLVLSDLVFFIKLFHFQKTRRKWDYSPAILS